MRRRRRSRSLPESFDHLTVTHVLRYVADPGATLAELARVVRPGGVVASLEFGVPEGPARPLWDLYVRTVLPLAGRLLRHGWREVGDFLGGSIRDFWARHPLERQLAVVARGGPPRGRGAAAELRRRRRHLGTEDVSPPDARPGRHGGSAGPVLPGTRSSAAAGGTT